MREVYTLGRQDFLWADSGDFSIQSGDLRDSREVQGLGFIEEVSRRVSSSYGDWKLTPEEGANIAVNKGKNNEESTWKSIKDSITYALILDDFLSIPDFQVYVAPVGINEVAVRIEFSHNIKRYLDPRLDSVKLIYSLDGEGPFIMR